MTATATAGSATTSAPVAPRASSWRRGGRITGLGAIVALYLCVVGIVVTFDARDLIVGVVSLGEATLLVTYLVTGYLAAEQLGGSRLPRVLVGILAGPRRGASLSAPGVIGSVV